MPLLILYSWLLGSGCSPEGLPPPPSSGEDSKGGESAADSGAPPLDSLPPGDSATPGDTQDTGGGELASWDRLVCSGERPKNLLLISIDTLRRGDMGFYSGGDTSPQLDALLASSVVLDQHRSCSNWTYPSMACALTGAYNEDHRFFPEVLVPYPDEAQTLAEHLADQGWTTSLVAAQDILDTSYNLAQGYETRPASSDFTAPEVIERSLDAIQSAMGSGAPWLHHAHFIEPHTPYTASDAYQRGYEALPEIPYDLEGTDIAQFLEEAWYEEMDEETQAAVLAYLHVLYEADLRYLDEQIGGMMRDLDALGALSETLVVIFSDHGEQLFEHGHFEHGLDLFVEETLALAAFSAPCLEPKRVSTPTSHADLAPTLLDLLGQPPLEGATGDVLGTFSVERPVFSSMTGERGTAQSVEIEDRRLFYYWDGPRVGYVELSSDSGELNDLYAEEADSPEVEQLWAALGPMTEALSETLGEEPD